MERSQDRSKLIRQSAWQQQRPTKHNRGKKVWSKKIRKKGQKVFQFLGRKQSLGFGSIFIYERQSKGKEQKLFWVIKKTLSTFYITNLNSSYQNNILIFVRPKKIFLKLSMLRTCQNFIEHCHSKFLFANSKISVQVFSCF